MYLRNALFPLLCAMSLAAAPQEDRPGAPSGSLGPVEFQIFAEGTYFHLRASATYAGLATQTPAMAKRLSNLLREAGIQTFGPLLIIQKGATEDLERPFEQEVGVLVPEGTKPVGEARVRRLPAFPCATTVARGAYAGEGAQPAFLALFNAAKTHRRVPTGEFREWLLFWESQNSPNNLMQIQIGLQ